MNLKLAVGPLALMVGLAMTSLAQANPSSGLLLGIYAYPNQYGLSVTGTIPGYSARGRLFPGDVLKRVTTDGFNIYPTRSHHQFELAKNMIGPYQTASLEVFRPGVGMVYLWVTFTPVGGGIQAYSNGVGIPNSGIQMRAEILTEKEKPGAAKMFHHSANKPTPFPNSIPRPIHPFQQEGDFHPGHGFHHRLSGAGSLFGN